MLLYTTLFLSSETKLVAHPGPPRPGIARLRTSHVSDIKKCTYPDIVLLGYGTQKLLLDIKLNRKLHSSNTHINVEIIVIIHI
jgi:hypothetical protein